MNDGSIFEDIGGVYTELKDGKNVLVRRNLQPYVDKLSDIEKLTLEALASGRGYEYKTLVPTEHSDKAFNAFKEAAKQLEQRYTVSINRDNLPVGEGEQPKTLFRIALTDKREDSPSTAAKKQFGVQRRNLANRAKDLQANPTDAAVQQAVRDQIKLTVAALQEADKLVKAEAESQTAEQLAKHQENVRDTHTMVTRLTEVVGDKAPAAAKK